MCVQYRKKSKCKQDLLFLSEKAVLTGWYFQNAEPIRMKRTPAMFFTDYKSFKSSWINTENQPKEKLPVMLLSKYCFVDITDSGNLRLKKKNKKGDFLFCFIHFNKDIIKEIFRDCGWLLFRYPVLATFTFSFQ